MCEQLHSDKTKKPMQLRHYGQCLVGISYIHLKQVEYLHTDCNEAFSKARLVLVRKRKVDLDPSKHKRHDITLPDRNNNNNNDDDDNINIDIDINNNHNNDDMEEDELVIDLNVNSSQLFLADNASDAGSLFRGSGSGDGGEDHLALDHEITMQSNELNISPTRINDRRSSFGGISSLDMGDMDIELRFDDNDDDENDNDILDESQAKRVNIQQLDDLTDVDDDDNKSVEQGRGVIMNNTTIVQHDNVSVVQSIDNDDGNSIHDDTSNVSLQKEKEIINLDDLGSVHSGSIDNGAIIIDNGMEIDDQSIDDQQSLHVQFDLDDQSKAGSVATSILEQQQQQQSQIENEEATPPPSPRANNTRVSNKNKKSNKDKNKLKRKKKKKNKKFTMDKEIEFERNELREENPDNFKFVYEGGRDSIHIWREFPLSTLEFDNLLYQPLAKQDYGKFAKDICDKFKDCNSKKVIEKPSNKQQSTDTDIDELADPNILRQSGDDVEQGRDDQFNNDLQDLPLPENDFVIDNDNNNDLHESMNDDQHSAIDEIDLHLSADDNASALGFVINDNISVEAFDKNISNLAEQQISDIDEEEEREEDEDDIDMEHDSNHLSFDTGDEDKLSETGDKNNNNNNNGIKLREWSKRAQKTFSFFESKNQKQFSFDELMKSQTKRDTVVGIFYELLVFKNHDLVELEQDKPYGDITISKTNNFYRHARKSRKISNRLSEIHASQQQFSQQQLSASRD